MKEMEPHSVLEEYDRQRDLYSDYASTLYSLIRDLLSAENFRPHSIQQRVKERASLGRKVLSDLQYSVLADVHDVAGIRIITYFADEVDVVASIVKREFEVDEITDKRAGHQPSQFGYRSLHCIVRLSRVRSGLPEYRRFANLRVEIQIRSILDHAWAEIEHDRGYKGSLFLPVAVQERFSELAALLRNADRQFEDVRDELQEHGRTIAWKTVRAEGKTELIGDITLDINMEHLPMEAVPAPWDLVFYIWSGWVTNRPGQGEVTDAFLEGAQPSTIRGTLHGQFLKFGAALQPALQRGIQRIRIANVRADATMFPPGAPVRATLEAWSCATGERVKLADQFEVARTCNALSFRVCGHGRGEIPIVLSRAAGMNNELAVDRRSEGAIVSLELCFREAFAGAFRTDLQEAGPYGTEVDHGTRLTASFSRLPEGVVLYVTARDLPSDTNPTDSRCKARLVDVENRYDFGGTAPTKTPANASVIGSIETVPIAPLGRWATAVWEWVDGDPGRTTPEEVRFGVVIAAKAGFGVVEGPVTVEGGIAPISTLHGASRFGPIPRFYSATSDLNILSVTD